MSAVSISELKANLSRYVREVRRGGEVEVLDRGVPVARMVTVGNNSDGHHQGRERLIGLGVLRPGAGNARAVLDEPPLVLPVQISDALLQDRADRLSGGCFALRGDRAQPWRQQPARSRYFNLRSG